MSTIFRCNLCREDFTEKRALVYHEKHSQRHGKKAGKSVQGFACERCGHEYNRAYDIARHQRKGQCPGVQATAAQQMVTSNKRKHDDEDSGNSDPRIRTTSPARIDGLGDSDLKFDTSNLDTMPPWIPEQAGAEAIPTSQELSLPQDAAAQYGAVDADLSTGDVLADIDLDGVRENTYLPLSTDISAAGNIATSALASPDNQGGPKLQVLPVNDDPDEISASGEVESSTHAMERTSMEPKPRSSFALSIVTGCSVASHIRSSIRSCFMDTSLKSIRLSWISSLSQPSSSKRASTVPSEMAAPMNSYKDEELVNSRASGSRLERLVPPVLQLKTWERLSVAVQKGITEDVADVLKSWIGYIDVNRPDDHGSTLLITATCNGHHGIVALLLLHQPGIDVDYKDTMGFSAKMYAHNRGHPKCQEVFALHECYIREIKLELDQKAQRKADERQAMAMTSRRHEKRLLEPGSHAHRQRELERQRERERRERERGPLGTAHKRFTYRLRELAEE